MNRKQNPLCDINVHMFVRPAAYCVCVAPSSCGAESETFSTGALTSQDLEGKASLCPGSSQHGTSVEPKQQEILSLDPHRSTGLVVFIHSEKKQKNRSPFFSPAKLAATWCLLYCHCVPFSD